MQIVEFRYPNHNPHERITLRLQLHLPVNNPKQVAEVFDSVLSNLGIAADRHDYPALPPLLRLGSKDVNFDDLTALLTSRDVLRQLPLAFDVLRPARSRTPNPRTLSGIESALRPVEGVEGPMSVNVGYNSAALQALKVLPERVIGDVDDSVCVVGHQPILNQLHTLQANLKNGSLGPEEYVNTVEQVMAHRVLDGPEMLSQEFAGLFDQIYAHTREHDYDEESEKHVQLHRHLHTLHVLPVYKALCAQEGSLHQPQTDDKSRRVVEATNWGGVTHAARVCYDGQPSEFVCTLIALLAYNHRALFMEVSPLLTQKGEEKVLRVVEGEGLSAAQVVLPRLMLDFSRLVCAVLRETIGTISVERSLMQKHALAARKAAKNMYHRLLDFTYDQLQTLLGHFSSLLTCAAEDPSLGPEYVKQLLRSVLQGIGVSYGYQLCHILQTTWMELQRHYFAAPINYMDKEAVLERIIELYQCADGCGLPISRVVFRRANEYLRPTCYLRVGRDETVGYAPAVLGTGVTAPTPVSSHILAHQKNMMEQVVGVRKEVLPDQRRAVMTTLVTNYRSHNGKEDQKQVPEDRDCKEVQDMHPEQSEEADNSTVPSSLSVPLGQREVLPGARNTLATVHDSLLAASMEEWEIRQKKTLKKIDLTSKRFLEGRAQPYKPKKAQTAAESDEKDLRPTSVKRMADQDKNLGKTKSHTALPGPEACESSKRPLQDMQYKSQVTLKETACPNSEDEFQEGTPELEQQWDSMLEPTTLPKLRSDEKRFTTVGPESRSSSLSSGGSSRSLLVEPPHPVGHHTALQADIEEDSGSGSLLPKHSVIEIFQSVRNHAEPSQVTIPRFAAPLRSRSGRVSESRKGVTRTTTGPRRA